MDNNLRQLLGLPNVDSLPTIEDTDVRSGDIIMLGVPREAVERGHVESYLREFRALERKKVRGQVSLSFAGYDYDPREIYQIREVRAWVGRLHKNVPHLFYFLSPDNLGIMIPFLCLADIQGGQGGQVGLDPKAAMRLIERISKAAVAHSKRVGDPPAVQFAVAERILGALDYDGMSQH